jgi:F-type H+-transporting ATPase subunit gamma
MANLKEVRSRIESVKSTQQITSAMKMVAASKLRKAQNAILTMRPYARKLQEIMQNVSSGAENKSENVYAVQRVPQRILIIAISSNRGLCGPFNANIGKSVILRINEKFATQYKSGNVDIFTIGKKGNDFLRVRKFAVLRRDDHILEKLSFETVRPIAEELMTQFAAKKYDHIEIIYNQFKNAAVQILQNEQFLPIVQDQSQNKGKPQLKTDYIYEPSKEEIIQELIPKSLKIQLYKSLLDSLASEHGARMTAMNKATENAQEMLKNLKLSYNKARQAAITNEILEIVSGAEALKG